MQVGLLWYDSDPGRTLADKIDQAARRYSEKFGRRPNRCLVHPSALDDVGPGTPSCSLHDSEDTIQLVAAPNILLHHFWLGITSSQTKAR